MATENLTAGVTIEKAGPQDVDGILNLAHANEAPQGGMLTGHLARAALEAMAYSTADVVDSMVAVSGTAFDRLRVDGGATQNDWLMQFQADVLGVAVERPANVETTAFGAAGLAGIAAGVWADAAEFYAVQEVATFEPARPRDTMADWRRGWARAMRAAVAWARDEAAG